MKTNQAVSGVMQEAVDQDVNWEVYWVLYRAVNWAVYEAVYEAVYRAVGRAAFWDVYVAVCGAKRDGPAHPAIKEFLTADQGQHEDE